MVSEKGHFPIFIFGLLLALATSCNKPVDKVKNSNQRYDVFLAKASQFNQAQQYDSAFYYYNKAKNDNSETVTADQKVYALINMAGIQQIKGDFSGSEATATDALDDLKTANTIYAISIYNILGIAFEAQRDYANAIRYYEQSLHRTTETLQKAIVTNNIAVMYMDTQQYARAIALLEPLTRQKAVTNSALDYARIIDNLGYCYFKTQNPKALDLLKESLKIRTNSQDDFALVPSYSHLGDFYSGRDATRAKSYALAAYQAATKINSADDRLEMLGQLVKESSGDELKKYALLHIHLNDSLNNARQIAKNQFAKIRYDDAKTREENANLKIERTQIATTRTIAIIIALFLILLLALLYLLWQSRIRKSSAEATHITEARISKKIHDELANDIYNNLTFADTQNLSDPVKKEFMMKALENIYARARDISRENSPVETGKNFESQLREMLSEYRSAHNKILISGFDSIPWTIISKEKKITVYRVLQELMVNMKKHSQATTAALQSVCEGEKMTIGYSDNGIGMQPAARFLKNGLRNVENRIHAIGGTITFDTEHQKGLRVTIFFSSKK